MSVNVIYCAHVRFPTTAKRRVLWQYMEMDEPLIDTLIEFNEHKWRRNHLTSEQSRFGNEQLIEADSVICSESVCTNVLTDLMCLK